MVTPASKRRAASVMVTDFRRSQRQACSLAGLSALDLPVSVPAAG